MKRFFDYYKPYKGLFVLDFGSAVFVGVLELIFPLMTSLFIDQLLPSKEWNKIVLGAVGLFAVFAFVTVLKFIVTYWGHKLGTNIERDIRNELYRHLQRLNFNFFDNNKTGKLIGRLTNDLMDIGELAHHGPEEVFVAVMTVIGALVIMLTIDVKLALITFCIVPIIFVLTIYFNQKMTTQFRRLFSNVSTFNDVIGESIGGIRLVQAFTNERFEADRFHTANEDFRATKLKAYNFMSWNSSIGYMSQKFTLIIVLILGCYFVLHDMMSYGEFVAFIMITDILFKPLQSINLIIELFPKGIAGFSNFKELMNTPVAIKDAAHAVAFEGVPETIRYEDVTFKYDDEVILDHLSFSVRRGEKIALVGPSGGGKTTICSLLPRFYDPYSGAVTINGRDTRDYTLESLRRQIGVVQQDVFLFSGTLRDNIAYGNLTATDEEIMRAVEQAQLKSFIDTLPQGIHTIVGERGTKLSGGQKQRVSIARMFLKNPPIIILDEATSALDVETENRIQAAFKQLSEGRTTLTIAHRLSTIRDVDRIFFIEDGRIVEEGSHEALLEKKGKYYALQQAQYEQVLG
ncbi:ABC transporter ATP-binding protein [Macrococcus equipercicus]|uniref:ABC transporter ATP-binding protein n=1 Tax=Macrococcus equipercicus TaxID=69967 RepID=A0A9Q9BM53_9STAP|nr:ABC transporter ATP-binding protein [Macrococcus equipercicus]UTH14088.1 ABC transporter ATP-binding protein [Macrococcus equipercicus]